MENETQWIVTATSPHRQHEISRRTCTTKKQVTEVVREHIWNDVSLSRITVEQREVAIVQAMDIPTAHFI